MGTSYECSTSKSTEVSTLSEGKAPMGFVLWALLLLNVDASLDLRSMENQTKANKKLAPNGMFMNVLAEHGQLLAFQTVL